MSANRKVRYNRGGSFYLVDQGGKRRKTIVIAWRQPDGTYLTRGSHDDGETWEPAVSIEGDAPMVDVASHYLSAG